MDLKQLRYFISVAEKLSFTEAAAEHFVAQSAISKQISNLEMQIGVQLFSRNRRSVKLTDAGIEFLKGAKGVLRQYDEAIKRARLAGSCMSGNIKIGYIGLEKAFLPKLINEFSTKYPGINIDFMQFTRDKLNSSLKNGEIDIGFTLSLSIEKFPDIQFSKISRMPISVILHSDHPLANQSKVNIMNIALNPIIIINKEISPDGYEHIKELFNKHGLIPNIVKECSRIETVLLLIEAGLGVAILPKAIVEPTSTLRMIEVEDESNEVDFIIAWNKLNNNRLISIFTSEVIQFFKQENQPMPITNL